MSSIAHEHLYIDSCAGALLERMHSSTNSTRARVGKSLARAGCADATDGHSAHRSKAYGVRGGRVTRPLLWQQLAAFVDERDVVFAQDLRDRRAVVGDQSFDRLLPFGLAVAHTHRNVVVEPDAGL